MISINQLENTLLTLYDSKCFVDLAKLTTSPTDAYKHFDSCYQETFANNDRLIFYSTKSIPDSLLHHLYQATSLIDISNCFVLICSPYDIAQQVTVIAELHAEMDG